MFVVLGVTGNTGSVVASTLLAANQQVRVVVRSADKGLAWQERGAQVAVASVEDADALAAAFQGAQGAYVMIPPPDPTSTGILARGARIAANLATALARSSVPHAVLLSSIGAQHPAGTGPIVATHVAEQELRALTATRTTFVRASYFMENLGGMLGAVHGAGVLPVLSNPTTRLAMIATHDIGETAAHALLAGPQGEKHAAHTIELSGPKEYSFTDAAAIFSALLGKPIAVAPVPSAGIVPMLTQAGVGAEMAELYREMSVGLDSGHVDFEGGAAQAVRGKVPLETVIAQLLSRQTAQSAGA